MGCGNDEASRSVLKGLLYPRYGKDERLFSKGTVVGGRKKNGGMVDRAVSRQIVPKGLMICRFADLHRWGLILM
jgi:hypothetical protein